MISSTSTKHSENVTLFLLKNSHKEDRLVTVKVVIPFYTMYERYQSVSLNDCLNVLLPKVFWFQNYKQISKFQGAIIKKKL